eukprot:TRINITY_DN735_c0_g1_i2.p1 TRINITY_DN735_c0_g1~~TRINITY_DN735_c0_g1_i2.p1  ORF type:complete len:801 (-),score=204.20 TRINITY_DN735_c0_g1_i2:57-2459(-)
MCDPLLAWVQLKHNTYIHKTHATHTDNTGHTPLMIASCNGHASVVRLLLSLASSREHLLHRTASSRKSALHLACLNQQEEVAFLLLDRWRELGEGEGEGGHSTQEDNTQSDLLRIGDNAGNTAVHAACLSGSHSILERLLRDGADPNASSSTGISPLQVCSMRCDGTDRIAAARVLLAGGAHTTAVNSFGTTPLHDACLSGNVAMARLLLSSEWSREQERVASGGSGGGAAGPGDAAGADSASSSLHMRDYDGLLPLHMVCNLATRGTLRRVGASETGESEQGDVAHTEAVLALVRLLVGRDEETHPGEGGVACRATCLDYSDSTPLHYLACSPTKPVVLRAAALLLDIAREERQGGGGAGGEGHTGSMATLEDVTGWSALHAAHAAVRNGKPLAEEMVALLQADIQAHDPAYLAAFDPLKPRGSNHLFHLRKGPHNRIPREERLALLGGELSLKGVAEYLMRAMAAAERGERATPRVIVMTGAGCSTSCGIPDFRTPNEGLYSKDKSRKAFDFAEFMRSPDLFYEVVRQTFLPVVAGKVQPSYVHHFIAMLEEKGVLLRNYTQNIDMLESIAGLSDDRIVESHGSFASARCVSPGCTFGSQRGERQRTNSSGVSDQESDVPPPGEGATKLDSVMQHVWDTCAAGGVPRCPECGGLVKPDVVFFGEGMPSRFMDLGKEDLEQCDLLLVLGTSLVVYPFAGMVSRVPLMTPRVLLNREAVAVWRDLAVVEKEDGVHRANETGGVDDAQQYRDVSFQGDCDVGVRRLAECLGWGEELEQRKSQCVFEPLWTPSSAEAGAAES